MRKFLFIFLFLGVLSLFLPQILSSTWGKKQIEAHLAQQLGGTVHIEHLSLSWWSQPSCKNVSWTDPKNGIVSQASSVQIESTLIECLRYKEKPLQLFIEGAKISSHSNFRFLKKKKRA